MKTNRVYIITDDGEEFFFPKDSKNYDINHYPEYEVFGNFPEPDHINGISTTFEYVHVSVEEFTRLDFSTDKIGRKDIRIKKLEVDPRARVLFAGDAFLTIDEMTIPSDSALKELYVQYNNNNPLNFKVPSDLKKLVCDNDAYIENMEELMKKEGVEINMKDPNEEDEFITLDLTTQLIESVTLNNSFSVNLSDPQDSLRFEHGDNIELKDFNKNENDEDDT